MLKDSENTKECSFFKTSFGGQHEAVQHRILERKKDLGQYISKLDTQINKALSSQNKAMSRKRQQILRNLNEVKQKARLQSEKATKMQEYFVKNCENILKGDICKWEDNKTFFQELFDFYQQKTKEKKIENDLKRQKIEEKTRRIKQLMRQQRQVSIKRMKTETTLTLTQRCTPAMNATMKTLNSNDSGKIKTQASLPALCRKRMMTLESQHETDLRQQKTYRDDSLTQKNYMKAIRTEKSVSHCSQSNQMCEIMQWYKIDKRQSYSWFEKLVFVDRNFKKVLQTLK